MRSRTLPTLAILVSILIFFGYTNPTYNGSIATAKAAIASNNSALQAATAYQQQADRLTAQQNSMDQAALKRLTLLLPDSVNNIGAILDLNALAARTGVALSSISASQSKSDVGSSSAGAGSMTSTATSNGGIATGGGNSSSNNNPVGSVDLTVNVKGTYAAFRSFLSGIETSERLMDATDISVSGSDTGVYTYQMTIRLYWLR